MVGPSSFLRRTTPASLMSSELTAKTADGWILEIDVYRPSETPVGSVLLTHAMMVDRRTYVRNGKGLVSLLVEAGWQVYNANFRGRGATGPTPEDGGQWTYDDIVQRDLPALNAAVRADNGGLPLILVGHSLGGHTAIAAVGTNQFADAPDAFVLLSANIWRPRFEPGALRRIQKSASIWTFERLARMRGYFPSRTLRMGPCSESYPYVADLCRTWTEDRWVSRDGALDYTEGMARVNQPVLSVIGAGDRLMAHHLGARNWFEGLNSERAEFWLAQNGSFGLDFDPDHMTLVTEPRSRPLWKSIERWMRTALGVG